MAEIKTGYVHKCGNTVKNWKRRWFVLKSNGYLYYYEDKNSTTEKGKIDVVDASRVGEWKEIASVNKKLPSGFSSSNAFGIVVKERTFTCVCENDGENLSWISTINKVRNAELEDERQYPEPTYPKEKNESLEVENAKTSKPATSPPYAQSDAFNSLPRRSKSPLPPEFESRSQTLPRSKSPTSELAPMPALPPSNPYYVPEVSNQRPPVQQFQPQFQAPPPQPQYRPPPQPQYRPPPQPQYRPPPQPQYRPPPQPQYRPPPQPYYQPQAQYRPPQPQYYAQPQYRPLPPQQMYRPAQPYAPPVYPQRPPVYRQAPISTVKKSTNITVVTVPAATQNIVYR